MPRTYVGRWLRAGMLDQREERDRLVRTLNGGSATGWNEDEPAVVEAAIELLLNRHFGPGSDPEALGELIELVSAVLVADNRPLDVPKAEALVDAALLDDACGADQVPRLDRFRLRMLVVVAAAARLNLDEADVDAALREAERVAFERGFHPPLVRRPKSAAGP